MKVDRTLWLTADRCRVVEDGDPEAAFLLATAGKDVPDVEAARLGLLGGSRPAAVVEEKQAEESANKQAAPAPNKARRSTKKRG